ncbi:hypothetical protein [Alkalihalophilus marmarensis]|uniref:hypothetical protein n=1 Tax=Alkalihalophilus marmarensis TaxID=521377 RepID=UPI002E24B2A7|nr:hypothetical protein [Alkalihalophilus marmarensis]
MNKLSKEEQEKLIDKEIRKWDKLCIDIPEKKRKAAKQLIERVAFMTITLQILEEEIKVNGPTIQFKNGSQEMLVENPSQKSYNTMINRYTAACDKLFNLFPKEAEKPIEQKARTDSDLI